MQRSKRLGRRHALLSLALSLSMCCGCVTTELVGRRCPAPNTTEIDDYAMIVEASPDRPAVRWVSRIIAYCWPDEAEEVRRHE